MSEIEQKVWGTTQRIFKNEATEVHRIYAKKGGYCSKHIHEHKKNLFFVEAGKLLITHFMYPEVVHEDLLEAGESLTVERGIYHRFEALEDTIAFEIYSVSIGDDIFREDVGGVRA